MKKMKEGYNNVLVVRVNDSLQPPWSLVAQGTQGQVSAECHSQLETDEEISEQKDMEFNL